MAKSTTKDDKKDVTTLEIFGLLDHLNSTEIAVWFGERSGGRKRNEKFLRSGLLAA